MNKQFFKALLCGVVILSAGFFASCKQDLGNIEDTNSQQEFAIGELSQRLSDLQSSGALVKSIAPDPDVEGGYIITLTQGEPVKIGSGGGVKVSVEDGVLVIEAGGEKFEIPMGSAVSSLIYHAQYSDGLVEIAEDGTGTAWFLATPMPTSDDLSKALFDFSDYEEVKDRPVTRAGSPYNGKIKVNGNVTIDGKYLKVPLKILGLEASKKYSVSLKMTLGSTSISSTYFPVVVPAGWTFEAENLATPIFAGIEGSATQDATTKAWTATLPEKNEAGDQLFLSAFNFGDFISFEGATSELQFVLAAQADQNEAIGNNYATFNAALAQNGDWELKARPGTNGGSEGLLMYVVQDDQIKAKVFWKVIDPMAGADLRIQPTSSPHMEYGLNGENTLFTPGAHDWDIALNLTEQNFSTKHDPSQTLLDNWKEYEGQAPDGTSVVINNGERLVPTEDGWKIAKFSRGIVWRNVQTSILDLAGPEIMPGGWDGISIQKMKELGMEITPDGFFRTDANYLGWGIRTAMGISFEYAYGSTDIAGNLCYIFFNRRVYNPDLPDPADYVTR